MSLKIGTPIKAAPDEGIIIGMGERPKVHWSDGRKERYSAGVLLEHIWEDIPRSRMIELRKMAGLQISHKRTNIFDK